jgi:hypothetical protein
VLHWSHSATSPAGACSRRRALAARPQPLIPMRRRVLPAGFIERCLPTSARQPRTGPEWVHEIKHDGYRLMARRAGDRVRLFTRRGYDWSDRYPRIVRAATAIESLVCADCSLAIRSELRRCRAAMRSLPFRCSSPACHNLNVAIHKPTVDDLAHGAPQSLGGGSSDFGRGNAKAGCPFHPLQCLPSLRRLAGC